MIKSMCFTSEGKYVYWTFKGSRVESPEPMTEMDIQQLEEYESWIS
tara:strand:+ start:67 stop:204 length:138 start_codon:yes stop_codon:yes gene_type:complete